MTATISRFQGSLLGKPTLREFFEKPTDHYCTLYLQAPSTLVINEKSYRVTDIFLIVIGEEPLNIKERVWLSLRDVQQLKVKLILTEEGTKSESEQVAKLECEQDVLDTSVKKKYALVLNSDGKLVKAALEV